MQRALRRSWSVVPITLAETISLDREFQGTLSHMNDRGASFAEIADYIEANLPVED